MKNVFIKVSGDLFKNKSFIEFLAKESKDCSLVVCVGGGAQINRVFTEAGVPYTKHGPLGRETTDAHLKELAKQALETNQKELQDILLQENISAKVIIPVLDIGSVLCHVNGDEMLRTAYIGFDELYVITIPERLEQKKQQFSDLPKITPIAIK